jgi:hypothetical protein
MEQVNYAYHLQHIHEVREEDEEEMNVKSLGFFSSNKQARSAIKTYKLLSGFRDKGRIASDYDDVMEGFFISSVPIGISYWDGGFISTSEEMLSGDTFINGEGNTNEVAEVTLNLPFWFKDTSKGIDEDTEGYATRIMKQKYQTDEFPRGPESEFYQIKWFKELSNQ